MNNIIPQLTQSDPGTLSPLALFLNADIVVKIVIIGLLLASIWTWSIIIAQSIAQARIRRDSTRFERAFWKADDIDDFARAERDSSFPMSKILGAGLAEWRLSTGRKTIDKEGTRARLATALGVAIA
ncbi:MAG: Tol-Pal system subunit TolQ, partial [Alphaproteobacteria bacterium]|nr:Tol-Pal system subunit TolQ [Alphaproteobacteria bacterium]